MIMSKYRIFREDMSKLRNLGLLGGKLLVGNRLDPSLLHVLSHLRLNRLGHLKFTIESLFRYLQKEDIQTSELRDSLWYSLMPAVVCPDLDGFGVSITLLGAYNVPRQYTYQV
jgi:hypothetical protein